MQTIDAILFEPVGCLAEFAADRFDAIAADVFGQPQSSGRSGSEAYWNVLTLMRGDGERVAEASRSLVEEHEVQAVEGARLYEDVVPALSELQDLGVMSIIVSSLSAAAVAHFLERFSAAPLF